MKYKYRNTISISSTFVFFFHQEFDDLNFDEIILEACKRIAAATGALVKAAGTAQRELVDSGRVKRRPTAASDDGQVQNIRNCFFFVLM